MNVADPRVADDERAHLCVDAFADELVSARALHTALETGLIDELLDAGPDGCTGTRLSERAGLHGRGVAMLVGLLRAGGVVAEADGRLVLTDAFRRALAYRDLLEARLGFAFDVLPDFHDRFTTLLRDPDAFMGDSRLFELFRYDRCFEPSPENRRLTWRWMELTTVLTRYEARACLNRYDFGRHRRMLDIGGNSGEFARQACRAAPRLQATVADLPLVCELGAEYLRGEAEAARIGFHPGDARFDPLPAGHDLVTFKSFLHDWPDSDARLWLQTAWEALAPGGCLLIYERGPLEVSAGVPGFSLLPHLLFVHAYREPDLYLETLRALGAEDLSVRHIALEMPFQLVTARKGGAR